MSWRPSMRALGSVLLAALAVEACIHDEFAVYNLAVQNLGTADRLIVLGTSMSGDSQGPAIVAPADGKLRVTRASTAIASAPGPAAVAAISVYDVACHLISRVTVHSGNHLIVLE